MLRSDKQIKSIIRDNANLMKILKIIHDLHLKQAALATGSIRNTVWQTLSEQPITLINDIDVVFFDPTMPKSTDRLIQQDLNDCASV
ncbi:nucleotidyltransferase family protein [Lentilactobacillus kisonensis]|nr:nucleotidyltransferase family protein [Lentilactobacillus kisonensis]